MQVLVLKIKFKLYFLIVCHIFVSLSSQSSNMLNQARLKVLKVREDHVRNVLDEARKRLAEVPHDKKLYSDLIVTLIVQALFQVMPILFIYEIKKKLKKSII